MAACGSLIHDCRGRWLASFTRKFAHVFVAKAELWRIVEGLKLAQSTGFNKVILKCDSLLAIVGILSGKALNAYLQSLLDMIFELKDSDWEIKFFPCLKTCQYVCIQSCKSRL